jgi:hypothetical protein
MIQPPQQQQLNTADTEGVGVAHERVVAAAAAAADGTSGTITSVSRNVALMRVPTLSRQRGSNVIAVCEDLPPGEYSQKGLNTPSADLAMVYLGLDVLTLLKQLECIYLLSVQVWIGQCGPLRTTAIWKRSMRGMPPLCTAGYAS